MDKEAPSQNVSSNVPEGSCSADGGFRNRDASKKSRKRRRQREQQLSEDIARLEAENRRLLAIEEENVQLAIEQRQLAYAIQERRGAMDALRRRRKAAAVQQFEMLVNGGLERAKFIASAIWDEDIVIYDAFEREGDEGLARRGRDACLSWWRGTTMTSLQNLECTLKSTSFPRGGDSLIMEWRMTGSYVGPLPAMRSDKCHIDCVSTFCFKKGSERISKQYITRSTTGLLEQIGVILGPSPRSLKSGSKMAWEEQESERWPAPLPKRQCIRPIPIVNSTVDRSRFAIKLSSQKYRASKVVKALQASEMQRILSLYSSKPAIAVPISGAGLASAA